MALQLEQERGEFPAARIANYYLFLSIELDNNICEKLRERNALPCLQEE